MRRLSLLCGLFLVGLTQAQSRLEPSPLIRVTRSGPLFKQPSGKSKVIADVPVGMVVFARRTSPSETWVQVEDENGVGGWYPLKWTNYDAVVLSPQDKRRMERMAKEASPPLLNAPQPIREALEKEDKAASKQQVSVVPGAYELAIGMQRIDSAGSRVNGLLSLRTVEKAPTEHMGFELELGLRDRLWAIRFLGRFFWEGSSLFRGIDLGLSSWKQDGESRSSTSLGLSAGIMTGSLLISARGGLLGLQDTKWTLGGGLTWVF